VVDYFSQGKRMYTCDLNFDRQGRPILLYVRSNHGNPGPGGDPREWVVRHWTGKEWEDHVVTISTHNYDMGSLYVEEGEWRILGPAAAGPQPIGTGGEVQLWVSRDEGKTWERRRQVTANSPFNHSYVRRPVKAKDPFYAMWADGHADQMSESRLYFCDSTGTKVMRLPYGMKEEFATPEEICSNCLVF